MSAKLHTSPERATRQVLRHRRETPPAPQPDAILQVGRVFAEFREALSRVDLPAGSRRTDTLQQIAERMVREAKALRPVGSLPHKQTLERSREIQDNPVPHPDCNCTACLQRAYQEGL